MFPYPSGDGLKRICPNCNEIIEYSCHSNYKLATIRNSKCRDCYLKTSEGVNKKGNILPLLEDTYESYYWIGFLLADGHFYKKGAIKCTLSIKDEGHLKKLSNFLSINSLQYNKEKTNCTIKLMDKKLVHRIVEKFNISNHKTYNPPIIEDYNLEHNFLISLICGFIDGDGCIADKNKGFSLTVKCHSSWLNNLEFIAKTINPTTNSKINGAGYAYFTISNYESLIKLKQKAISLNLPIMSRKWDKIKLDYVVNKVRNDLRLDKFKKLYTELIKIPYYAEKIEQIVR